MILMSREKEVDREGRGELACSIEACPGMRAKSSGQQQSHVVGAARHGTFAQIEPNAYVHVLRH